MLPGACIRAATANAALGSYASSFGAVTVAHSRAVRRSYATTDPVTDDWSMHVGANVRGRLVRQHGRYLLRFAGGV